MVRPFPFPLPFACSLVRSFVRSFGARLGSTRHLACLRRLLLLAALLPAVQVEKGALVALPGKLLGADGHVVREGSLGPVVVLLDGQVLGDHREAAGDADDDGDPDPGPELGPLLVVGLVGVGRQDLLLVGDPGPDLLDGLGLHLGLRPGLGDRLDPAGVGGCVCGSSRGGPGDRERERASSARNGPADR
ncbi:unnamed protein product [Pseudo-nitzschia multistriata]|uniref:Uncharacterized protein n=1 Tax=Pseudo-nitzschia multistriata TaxID=183589 RepID=A0A448ZM19_9STRA|nr:unnamed protein product [Pseudo-nitzschia multistriata]